MSENTSNPSSPKGEGQIIDNSIPEYFEEPMDSIFNEDEESSFEKLIDLKDFSSMPENIALLENKAFNPWDDTNISTHKRDVSISQTLDSLNRRIESKYQCDIFRMQGYLEPGSPGSKPHTRIFEVVGDWIPNIAFGNRESKANFYQIVKWASTTTYYPATEGLNFNPNSVVRYKLLNGKYIDIPRIRGKMYSPFIVFKEHKDFYNLDVRGIRSDVTSDEFLQRGRLIKSPLSTAQLFSNACSIAKSMGKNYPCLVCYIRPTPEDLGGTKEAISYCDIDNNNESFLRILSDESYKEILISLFKEMIEELEDDNDQKLIKDYLKIVEQESFTEEQAKEVYLQQQERAYGNPNKITTGAIVSKDPITYVEENEENILMEVHFDGAPHLVETTIDGHYHIPSTYSILPRGSTKSTSIILSALPSISDNLRVCHGSYQIHGKLLCDSITPRIKDESRGVIYDDPLVWKEKLNFSAHYQGVIIRTKIPSSDEFSESYAVSINTYLLKDYIRNHSQPDYVYLLRPNPGLILPKCKVPPYLEGISYTNGELIESPLIKEGLRWFQVRCFDARVQLPKRVIEWLTKQPDKVKLLNAEEYFKGNQPLFLEVQDGIEPRIVTYDDNLKINLQINESVVVNPKWSDDYVEESADFDFSIDPPKIEYSSNEENKILIRKYSDQFEEWGKHPIYSTNRRPFKPGDWRSFFDFYQSKRNPDHLNMLYSACWDHANDKVRYEIMNFFNPKWYTTLKGEPLIESIYKPGPHNIGYELDLMINDDSQIPVAKNNAVIQPILDTGYGQSSQVNPYSSSFGPRFIRGSISRRDRGRSRPPPRVYRGGVSSNPFAS